jgi:hypothetical protein
MRPSAPGTRRGRAARGRTPRGAALFVLALIGPAAAAEESPPSTAAYAPHLVERISLLASPARLERTLALPGGEERLSPALAWELRLGDESVAAGRIPAGAAPGEKSLRVSVDLPEVEEPAGLELLVAVGGGSGEPLRSRFPFTLYPRAPGQAIVARFARSTAAIFDPEGSAGGVFESLGFRVVPVRRHDGLLDTRADLIAVGSGGFSRGHEPLGPILARLAGRGTPVLILDQPSVPATLTPHLRLWPSFAGGATAVRFLAAGHPAFVGPAGRRAADYLGAAAAGDGRPYLPPTGGNFRALAGTRVGRGPAREEGIGIVEIPMGRGTVVAAQIDLVSAHARDPGARIVLINLLAYLLGEHAPFRETYLYGPAEGALSDCIGGLAPDAPPAPADLIGVELLIVPAGWQAPRRREAAPAAPLADVARFLSEGGTILLVDPQPIVAGYLTALLGERVEFGPPSNRRSGDGSISLLEGIADEDLDLLGLPGERDFLLRSLRPADRLQEILRIPGLSAYRVGRGTLVALAMPRSIDCRSPRAASLLARLLTNLGVPLEGNGDRGMERFTRLER